jgi:hypothetical protein
LPNNIIKANNILSGDTLSIPNLMRFEPILDDNHLYVVLADLLPHAFTIAIGVSNVQNYRPIKFYLETEKFRQVSVTFEKAENGFCRVILHHFQKVWMGIPFETPIYQRKGQDYIDIFEWISSLSSTIIYESYLYVDDQFDTTLIDNISTRILTTQSLNQVIHFSGAIRAGQSPVSDYSVEYHFNLYQLETKPMIGRVGDPQIGYFYDISDSTHMSQYDDHIAGDPVPIIHRLNTAKAPWCFVVDHSIPKQYQNAVKTGLLSWNRYFKKIGLGEPITVSIAGDTDYPVDINIFDAQCWYVIGTQVAEYNGPYSGYSVYIDDYRSGENLFGLICLNLVKIASVPTRVYYMSGQVPIPNLQTPPQLESYISSTIALVSAHETGHQLGLRHNFLGNLAINRFADTSGSFADTSGSFADTSGSFADTSGSFADTSGSLMDYNDLFTDFKNLKNLDLCNVDRKYDLKAIEYGYRPLKGEVTGCKHPQLTEIANRVPTQFATDENYFESVNPDVGIFEDTPQTLKYITQSLKLYHQYREHLIQLVVKGKISPFEYNNMFLYLYQLKYTEMIMTCLKYIGGRTYGTDRRYYLEVNHTTIITALQMLLKLLNAIEYTPQEYSYYIFDANSTLTRQSYNPVKVETFYSMNKENLFGIYKGMILQAFQGMTSAPNLIRFFQNHNGNLTIADLLFNFTFANDEPNQIFEIQGTNGIFPEIGKILSRQSSWQKQVQDFLPLQSYRQILWIDHLKQCYTSPELLIIRSDLKLLFYEIQQAVSQYILPYAQSLIQASTLSIGLQPFWKSNSMKIVAHWELIIESISNGNFAIDIQFNNQQKNSSTEITNDIKIK